MRKPFSPENAKSLGRLIESRIVEKGLFKKAVSRRAEISYTYLLELINGERYDASHKQLAQPTIDVIRRLDKVLDLGKEAYVLSEYAEDSYNTISTPTSVEETWNVIFDGYVSALKKTFVIISSEHKKQLSNDIVDIIEKYRSKDSTSR